MWLMLQVEEPEEFVIATGEVHSVREFVEKAFKHVGKTIVWEGKDENEVGRCQETGCVHVRVDHKYYRPTEVSPRRVTAGSPGSVLPQRGGYGLQVEQAFTPVRLAGPEKCGVGGRRSGAADETWRLDAQLGEENEERLTFDTSIGTAALLNWKYLSVCADNSAVRGSHCCHSHGSPSPSPVSASSSAFLTSVTLAAVHPSVTTAAPSRLHQSASGSSSRTGGCPGQGIRAQGTLSNQAPALRKPSPPQARGVRTGLALALALAFQRRGLPGSGPDRTRLLFQLSARAGARLL
ncbi:hypothetical protein COCON_G00069670 [Conger conger]|uniref:GDP-D-mannose dehydratase n=1 Tax=Conger conger TaxID=82655 RepID=A0A9Q1DT68_CONCO|nr:hypothetical protein COCON_G00069670 [Conger conger]